MNIHSNSKRTQNWKHKKAVQRMLRIEKGEEGEMGTAYQGREYGGGEAGGHWWSKRWPPWETRRLWRPGLRNDVT